LPSKNLPCQQYLYALKDLYQVIFGNAHFFFLKRAKKPLPYINIGEANKGMARTIKEKEKAGKEKPARKGTKQNTVSLKAPPGSSRRQGPNPFLLP
jgi:hypothetical protein